MAFTQSSRIGSQTRASVEHRLAAREGLLPKTSELRERARDARVPKYTQLKAAGLQFLDNKGWDQITDDDIAEAMNMK